MCVCVYMYIYTWQVGFSVSYLDTKNQCYYFHIRCSSLTMLFFALFITCCIKSFQFCVFLIL